VEEIANEGLIVQSSPLRRVGVDRAILALGFGACDTSALTKSTATPAWRMQGR